MARVYGIQKRLEQNNIDGKLVKEIIGDGNLVGVITRMEKLLDHDLMARILDSCACTGGKEYLKKCEKIGKEIAGKPLREKIDRINSISPESDTVALNADGTLTVTWRSSENGRYRCVCIAAMAKGVTVAELAAGDGGGPSMPLSYCLCCAGSGRRHLQLQLGVELRTKEIVSSPIHSRGEKPCEFILEIVEDKEE